MKKSLAAILLPLAVILSWAFHSKSAEPGGYMILACRTTPDYSIILTDPTGNSSTQLIDPKSYNSIEKSIAANLELRKAEIRKLNELKIAGWRVVSASTHPNGISAIGEYTYLLEK